MANILGYMRDGLSHVLRRHEEFGPVFRTKFGPSTIVWVSDPDIFLQVARNEDGAWSTALAWLALIDGLDTSSATLDMSVTLDFDPHKQVRKLMQQAFSPPAVASYTRAAIPMFESEIDSWVRRGRVDFKQAIRTLLANVSTRTFLGVDDDREAARLDRALGRVWRAPFALVKNRWASPTWRKATDAHTELRETLGRLVAVRRRGGGQDLFSRLCRDPAAPGTESSDPGQGWLDDPTLVRIMIGVLIGAFDTTASGLASMAYLLAKHPVWQERLRDEVLRSEGQDAKRLEDVENAWKESLRLFPVSSHLPRYALRDVKLGPWRNPGGHVRVGDDGALAVGPRVVEGAGPVHSERFSLPRAEDRRHKAIFMPFGAGAHACIGMSLATAEVTSFWRTMLSRCRFRLEPDYEGHHTYVPLGTVSGDVALILEPLAR